MSPLRQGSFQAAGRQVVAALQIKETRLANSAAKDAAERASSEPRPGPSTRNLEVA